MNNKSNKNPITGVIIGLVIGELVAGVFGALIGGLGGLLIYLIRNPAKKESS